MIFHKRGAEMRVTLISTLFLVLALGLLGCSGQAEKSTSDDINNPQAQSRVIWERVPPEFNPRVEDVQFQTTQIEKLNINVFNFDRDFEIVYSRNLEPGQGFLRLFRVWSQSSSWGDLTPRKNGKILELRASGSYNCSINVRNGQITSLKGGCYVRAQVHLPVDAKIEVYNVGQLKSKKFFPLSNLEFFQLIKQSFNKKERFLAIEDFLNSYVGTDRQASLSVKELTEVMRYFTTDKDRLEALRQLHRTVMDRDGLKSMVLSEISVFDREEALDIITL
jgi:hypothetical protein